MSIDDKFKEIGILNRLHAERERADIRARYGNIPESEMRVRIGVLRYGRETMENVTNARHVVQSSDCCGNSLK
ncbi:MAG TPA: hypothetical protein VFY65_14700 [Longimicrobium sp.]|nr:hypothetical protein [Longimicrobium sp.]